MEDRVKFIMECLKCTEEEAKDVIAYDKAIDKAKATDRLDHDLTLEQEKMAKKFANVTTHKKPVIPENGPRPRKANATKREMIEQIAEIFSGYKDFTIKNPERLVAFMGDNGKVYTITLAETRKASVADV